MGKHTEGGFSELEVGDSEKTALWLKELEMWRNPLELDETIHTLALPHKSYGILGRLLNP